jgi:hypothetical protein
MGCQQLCIYYTSQRSQRSREYLDASQGLTPPVAAQLLMVCCKGLRFHRLLRCYDVNVRRFRKLQCVSYGFESVLATQGYSVNVGPPVHHPSYSLSDQRARVFPVNTLSSEPDAMVDGHTWGWAYPSMCAISRHSRGGSPI